MFLREIITCTQMLFCLISVVLNAEKQDLPEALKKMKDIKLGIKLSNDGEINCTSTFNNCNYGNIRLDLNFENPVRLFKHLNQSKRGMKTTFESSTSSSDIGDKKDDMTTIPQKKEEGATEDGLKEDSFDRKTSPLSSKDRAAKDEKHDDDSQSPYKSVFLIQRNSPAIPSLFLDCILRRYGMDSPSNQEKVTTENSNKNPQTSEATDKKEKADEKEQKELFTSDIKKRYTSSESSSSDSFSDKLSDLIQNISSSKNSKNLGEDSQENLISKETESSNLNTLSKENGDVNQKNSENSEVKHDPESTVTTLA